ncbi:MAG TPA: TolC family outer membrane protein [Xanthobacteraceae bacterium]|nr:TolC family outer membrane protein [Xanthobacteraceae bacterium]
MAIVAIANLGVGSLGLRVCAADTLDWALAQAYQNNPTLNAQRAAARAQDEGVPQALSGYRPRATLTATVAAQNQSLSTRTAAGYSESNSQFTPHTVGVTVTQTLFNGYQTANRTRQAEAQVSAGRATLAVTEEQILLNAATAYMNLLRDGAILDLQRRNVEVLQEQLRQTRDRFNVGEVTRTDVAQAESRLAAGRSQVLTAESNYVSSKAIYRQIIGVEPGKLAAATPVDRLSPRTLIQAIATGREFNPNVAAAMFGIDTALLQVKINEGALLPTVTATANVQQAWEPSISQNVAVLQQFSASLLGQVTVPIYQGGGEYSLIRQAKETLGQQRINLDTARDLVQSNVVQAWGQLEAAKAQIQATQAQVNAAEIALNGVREEARVGQRTTLDVLNAQQELVNARVALVTAQRDRVVASYTLLSAVGGLYAVGLGLKVPVYDPMTHYQQVRDAWAGTRNPDGR